MIEMVPGEGIRNDPPEGLIAIEEHRGKGTWDRTFSSHVEVMMS
jgi:hypothetical protein